MTPETSERTVSAVLGIDDLLEHGLSVLDAMLAQKHAQLDAEEAAGGEG